MILNHARDQWVAARVKLMAANLRRAERARLDRIQHELSELGLRSRDRDGARS